MTAYDIIKRPIITEQSMEQTEMKRYSYAGSIYALRCKAPRYHAFRKGVLCRCVVGRTYYVFCGYTYHTCGGTFDKCHHG